MAAQTIRIIAFREGDAWVAHCLEYDITTQAADLGTLRRRIELTIELDLRESLRRHGEPFRGIGSAPEYVRQKWDRDPSGFRLTGVVHTDGATPASVDYEMALCA